MRSSGLSIKRSKPSAVLVQLGMSLRQEGSRAWLKSRGKGLRRRKNSKNNAPGKGVVGIAL